MAGKPATPKHIPLRTCVGCRAILAKRVLIRVVRRPNAGVVVDPSGKLAGRGAYLHNRKSCWERGLKGGLANALKTTLTSEDRQRLEEFMSSLPEDSADTLTPYGGTAGAGPLTGASHLTGDTEVLNA
jgi:predicted RNA-binding protein YlxR (DUF448 family)